MSLSQANDPLPEDQMIVISVGTDHHPFARLVEWAEAWAKDNPTYRVIVQRGTVAAPVSIESHDLIPHDELRRLFAAALVVVSHGGPSTVMDARMAGRLPIVVPRDNSLGEHVDDHQLRFARHLDLHGLARCATTREEFDVLMAEALAHPETFTIPRQELEAASGVVKLGKVLDDLLGIQTRLTPNDIEPHHRPVLDS
ncbi:MAG: glycosyltransferase [Acidimicrobiales bacterium]